jgi:hypothetical protein
MGEYVSVKTSDGSEWWVAVPTNGDAARVLDDLKRACKDTPSWFSAQSTPTNKLEDERWLRHDAVIAAWVYPGATENALY